MSGFKKFQCRPFYLLITYSPLKTTAAINRLKFLYLHRKTFLLPVARPSLGPARAGHLLFGKVAYASKHGWLYLDNAFVSSDRV